MMNKIFNIKIKKNKSFSGLFYLSFRNVVILLVLIVFCFTVFNTVKATTCPSGTSSFQFTRDLKFGMKGEDVKELQKYLNNNGFLVAKNGAGSKGHETTFFGRLTQAALKKFLLNKNTLNLNTRDYLNCNQENDEFQFTRDLKFGMKGEDVKELQKYLNNNGFLVAKNGAGSKGHETTFFGRLTQAALKKYRDKELINIDSGNSKINTNNNSKQTNNLYYLVYSIRSNGDIFGNKYQTIINNQNGTPVTAIPNNGYYFTNWSDGLTVNPRIDKNITSNKFIVANFTHVQRVLHGNNNRVIEIEPAAPDTTAPIISEVTPVASIIADSTPNYTLTTDEAGTITYGGDCSSTTTSASVGSNTIIFSTLSDGSHSNCTIYITDSSSNQSNTITTTSFIVDTTSPTVSVSAPSDGNVVSGNSVTISASASDTNTVSGVQFKLDTNTNIGTEDTSSPYSISWDSTGVSDGAHTIIAVASDGVGNQTTSTTINITVDNTGPVISFISSGSPTDIATITWTTNENSDSQLEYGITSGYGSTTTLDATLVTSHSVGLTGLAINTLYHYRILSRDAQGNISTSVDQTFTTTQPSWIPVASGINADYFADFSTEGTTNHYLYSNTIYGSAAAYLTAINGFFTHSTGGYYATVSGLITQAVANMMRIDYDQNSLVSKGVLLEGGATNLFSFSESTTIGWSKINATVTENSTSAPDGASTAMRLVESSATGYHYIAQSASSNIISIFAKAGERNWAWLNANDGSNQFTYFDLTNGVVGTNAAGNTATIIQYPNGWYLISVRRSGITSPQFGIASADNTNSYTGDISKSIYIWGMNARSIVDGTLDSYIKRGVSGTPNLIGYWKMDESSIGTRADATGNNWTLTNNNGVTNNTGLLNNASDFTRASSMYLSHVDALGLRPGANSFGVSVWVKFNSFSNYQDIISKWGGGSNVNEFTLESDSAGNVGFYVSNGTTHNATWGTALSTGTWYNIIGWYNSEDEVIGISVNNGTPVTTAHTGGATCTSCTANFKIGSSDASGWSPYLDGLLDEVAYFSGAPGPSDRTFIYGSGTPPNVSTWPVGLWGGEPTRVQDLLYRNLASSPAAITKVLALRTPHTFPVSGSFQVFHHMDDGSESNDFEAYRDDTGRILVEVHINNAAQPILDMGIVGNDTDFKLAFRGQSGDLAASMNGGTVIKVVSSWPTNMNIERLGVNQLNTRHWNSTIKSDTTFLIAVSDSDLQLLSQ